MIHQIKITGVENWPDEAHEQLANELAQAGPIQIEGDFIRVNLPEIWPPHKRERFKHNVSKTLHEVEVNRNLSATLLTLTETDKKDRQDIGFDD